MNNLLAIGEISACFSKTKSIVPSYIKIFPYGINFKKLGFGVV